MRLTRDIADDVTVQADTQVKDSEQIEDILTELAELSIRMHTATLQQVASTTQAFELVKKIAEKAQQIVERTTHQHERSQHVFGEIQTLKAASSRHVENLQEAQYGAQELVLSVGKLHNLVRRFKV